MLVISLSKKSLALHFIYSGEIMLVISLSKKSMYVSNHHISKAFHVSAYHASSPEFDPYFQCILSQRLGCPKC